MVVISIAKPFVSVPLGIVFLVSAVVPTLIFSASAKAAGAEMTKPTFVKHCAGENSLGSQPACVCVWGKINESYAGLERKLMIAFYTTSFADWEPTDITEKRQDELLDESIKLSQSCGVEIKP